MGLFKISSKNYAIGSIAVIQNGKYVIIRKNRLFRKLKRPFKNYYYNDWKDIKSKSIFNIYDRSGKISAINLETLNNINEKLKYINRFKERKIAKEINKCNYVGNNPKNKKEDNDIASEKAYQYIKKLI